MNKQYASSYEPRPVSMMHKVERSTNVQNLIYHQPKEYTKSVAMGIEAGVRPEKLGFKM